MDINLGYIEGISYIDTPYFPTRATQRDYFNSKLVVTIGSTFYPPHYTNLLRISADDINFNTQVNYVWFTYNNKIYYYFIDSIEYINEELIEISIVMDVIQTYMFDIRISNGVIERMFINRFDSNNKINRNYIRENVSAGLFTKQKTTFTSDNYWLVVKIAKLPHVNTQGYKALTNLNINGRTSYVPYGYLYMPLFCTGIRYQGSSVIAHNINVDNILDILTDNEVIEAYIIDYNPRPDAFAIDYHTLVISNYTDHTIVTPLNPGETNIFTVWYSSVILIDRVTGNNGVICNATSLFRTYQIGSYDVTLYRYKNTSTSSIFEKAYITQLLDENYYRIEFGNGGGVATYPLFALDTNSIYLREYSNLDDGSKIFEIDDGSKTLYTGLDYQTYVFSNIKPTIPLLNDAWKNYQANNQGRWIAAGISAVRNAINSFAGIPAKNAYINNRIATLEADPHKYDRRFKELTLKSSYVRKMDDLKSRKQAIRSDTGIGIIDTLAPLINQGVSDLNAQFAPNSIRMGGDFISSYLSSQYMTMYRHLEVNDIEQVANYYHRNGFKVDLHVNSINNIFQYVQNRYYFNMLKMSDSDLHLADVIENAETVNLIKDRLKDGIRLWNVMDISVNIGDFTYDNVELDYINE